MKFIVLEPAKKKCFISYTNGIKTKDIQDTVKFHRQSVRTLSSDTSPSLN